MSPEITTGATPLTANLQVIFQGSAYREVKQAPVAVEIIDSDLEVIGEMPMKEGQVVAVPVAPGSYLVRAHLPSGETISNKASVKEGESKLIVLQVAPSRNESLSQPSFFKSAAYQTSRTQLAPFIDKTTQQTDLLPAVWMRVWRRQDSQNWEVIPWPGSRPKRFLVASKCELFGEYPFVDRWPLFLLQIGGPIVPWRFVSLPAGPPSSFVSLGVTVHPSPQSHARSSDPLQDMSGGVNISIVSPSEDAESLLGYLDSGALGSARLIAEPLVNSLATNAESMLRGKVSNPMAAAIGGYYLLRIGALEQMHNWPNNFANWIDWLPDSAVIHAWQLLRAEGPENVTGARKRLLEATQRGVPIYTEGIRLLFDGLRLVRQSDTDSEVDFAISFIQKYADALDWSQPLTTFYGEAPGFPTSTPRLGVPSNSDKMVWVREP